MPTNLTHKPNPAVAYNFDGSIDSLVEIIGAVVPPEVTSDVNTVMAGGGIQRVTINAAGIAVQFQAGDVIVVPANHEITPFVASDAVVARDWDQ